MRFAKPHYSHTQAAALGGNSSSATCIEAATRDTPHRVDAEGSSTSNHGGRRGESVIAQSGSNYLRSGRHPDKCARPDGVQVILKLEGWWRGSRAAPAALLQVCEAHMPPMTLKISFDDARLSRSPVLCQMPWLHTIRVNSLWVHTK